MAAESSRAYSGGARRMWKASRCAVFSPMPGSRASDATSRLSGSGVMRGGLGEAGDLHPAGDLVQLFLHVVAAVGERRVHRRGDGVLQQRLLVGVEELGVDLQALDLLGPGGHGHYQPVPRLPLHRLLGELLLPLLDLLGELVGLPDEVVQIDAWHGDALYLIRGAAVRPRPPAGPLRAGGGRTPGCAPPRRPASAAPPGPTGARAPWRRCSSRGRPGSSRPPRRGWAPRPRRAPAPPRS